MVWLSMAAFHPSAVPEVQTLMTNDESKISHWCRDIIEGVGGLNDFERYELAVPNVSERVWAAAWTLRCLANPKCEGSDDVLRAIMDRRGVLAASEGKGE